MRAGGRRLTPGEAALWARVVAQVNPIDPRRLPAAPPLPPEPAIAPAPSPPIAASAPPARVKGRVPPPRTPAEPSRPPPPPATLDGGWDRRLARGLVAPDTMVDLHGHTLASAYAALDAGLERAIARGDRVLLLVTGKPPRPESERPHARGAIRSAVGDWIAASRHAARIAAVRGAHPRHGGAGALYIVLRRPRETAAPRKS